MSYCRWSTDDSQCDLYLYASCHGGWSAHVAGRRHVLKEPLPPVIQFPAADEDWYDEKAAKWFERHNKVQDMLRDAELTPIGGTHDGDSVDFDTIEEVLEYLAELRKAGYRFPEYVEESLKIELEQSEKQ